MLPQRLRSFESDGAITECCALRATSDDTNVLAHFSFVLGTNEVSLLRRQFLHLVQHLV